MRGSASWPFGTRVCGARYCLVGYALDTPTYQKSDVRDHIASAYLTIVQFKQAAVDANRGFVAHVLFRQR